MKYHKAFDAEDYPNGIPKEEFESLRLIKREVSDGVIAPGYTDEALELLKQKKKGA